MPWKECSVMEERLRFVARLLDGESVTDICREFGISRNTGYKIFSRYKDQGVESLCDRSRPQCGTPTSCRRKSKTRS
jgi:transposase